MAQKGKPKVKDSPAKKAYEQPLDPKEEKASSLQSPAGLDEAPEFPHPLPRDPLAGNVENQEHHLCGDSEFDSDERKTAPQSTASHTVAVGLSGLAHEVKKTVKQAARTPTHLWVEELEGLQQALDQASIYLEEEGHLATARMLNSGAQGCGRLRASLEDKSLKNFFSLLQDYARREPLMLFAGAAAAGFALSRFARSSSSALATPEQKQMPEEKAVDEPSASSQTPREQHGGEIALSAPSPQHAPLPPVT
jgi:hypothetical protein